MGCKNCGDKPSQRFKPTIVVKDIDTPSEPGVRHGAFSGTNIPLPVPARETGFLPLDGVDGEHFTNIPPDGYTPKVAPPAEPTLYDIFQAAKNLSLDEIMTRALDHQKATEQEIERAFAEMTEPMRIFHVLNLLSVANYDNLSSPGISPDQALVGIKTALDRKDFNKVNELYPNLKEKITTRYKELASKKITLD